MRIRKLTSIVPAMEIQRLKPEVVDQIAAGEVVERPAHLIKELIENSLDAMADQVEVDVSEGGKKVRVQDNGVGIYKDDLPLSCARHATSKIKTSDDLWNLITYGFRGEALASISSVSRLKITSKRKGEKQAFMYENTFGKSGEPLITGSSDGTTIEIEDLFSNVPARLKFLKSDSAEVTQIKNVIKAQALAYPEVEFRFKQNGKVVFYYQKDKSLVDRAQKVLGCKKMYAATNEYEGYQLDIAYSSPNETFGTSKQIWSFVQNRWVQDKTIMAAVMEAYRSLLMHGEFPFCVIKLTAPKEDVDVNIHPTKSQVKFKENSKIFRFVNQTLRASLEQAPWLGSMSQTKPKEVFSPPVVEESSLRFRDQALEKVQYSKKSFHSEAADHKPSLEDLRKAAEVRPTELEAHSFKRPQAQIFWSKLQVLAQTHLTYILAEGDEALFLIDQHAAHERVVFERLMYHWQNGKFEIQNYLLPLSVDLSSDQVEALMGLTPDFQKMGLEVEQGGPETLLVNSAPSFISEKAIQKSLVKFADEVMTKGGSFSLENKISDIFATMACHSVIRAGQSLSQEQMVSLLEQMDEFAFSSYCPHGRNVYVEIPYTKIEKDFGRIV